MLEALLGGFAAFAVTFLGLRGLEWLYHRRRHTKDWSPHWGSWLFGVLIGLYAFLTYYGRTH